MRRWIELHAADIAQWFAVATIACVVAYCWHAYAANVAEVERCEAKGGRAIVGARGYECMARTGG